MKIKAIFYDFDGVIKASTQIKTEAFYDLYLPHGKTIAEKARQHHIENGGISRYEKFKHYHKTFLNIELSGEAIEDLAQQFSDIVLKRVISSPYVDGALAAIKNLGHRFDQFIVTGTPQHEIEFIINALGLSSYFKGIYGSPDNKIQISEQILAKWHYTSDEVVFIGDATTDYKAASHFNFHFILRTHAENEAIFKEINTIKSKDLTNLEALINNI